MAEAKRDNNRVPTLLGVSDVDFITPTTVAVDPVTHALAVEATINTSGSDELTTGTIVANSDTVVAAVVEGMAGWTMSYYGTYATGASLTMEASFDGGITYTTVRMLAGTTSTLGYVLTIAAVSNSMAYFTADIPTGATHLRVRCSAWAAPTGAINVIIGQSMQRNATPPGAITITSGTVTTLTTLTNITNWGNIVDNAAFVDGTTRLMPGGYIFDEVAGTALTENDAAAARIDSKRAQITTLEDATTRGLRATIRDLAANDALNVAIVDGAGGQITTFGGGVQYTEGDTDASVTGTAVMWEDGSDTLRVASAAKPFPVEIVAGAGSGGTAAADDADFTAGVTSGTPAMGVYESAPTTVTDGDLGTVGITSGRRLKTSSTIDVALPAGTNNIGDVDVLSSALPTGAATSANQTTVIGHLDGVEGLLTTIDADTGSILTAVQLIDNAVSGAGFNITQFGGAAVPIGAGTEAAAIRVTLPTNGTGIVGLAAGTNGIGKLTANTGVDIGDVDVTSVVPGTGATNLGKAEDGGHTSGDVGVFNLGVRVDTPNVALTNTDADYSALTTNKLGSLRTAALEDDLATAATKHVKKYYTNAGAVTDGIIWSPAAGTRWFITTLVINVSAACTVTLEDDLAAGDAAVMKFEFAANSGIVVPFPIPMFSGEDAADLLVTTTAGNVYCTVIGYEI